MSVFSSDPETAGRNVDAALVALMALIAGTGDRRPSTAKIRAMQDQAYAIIRQAQACHREAVGIAAHMFCNYLDGQMAAKSWSAQGVAVHADALRCLSTEPDRAAAERVLHGLLKLSQHHLAASA